MNLSDIGGYNGRIKIIKTYNLKFSRPQKSGADYYVIKKMDKINKIITLIVGISAIIDIALKCLKNPHISFLTTPVLPLNILEILITIAIIVLIYRFLPNKFYRRKLQIRSERFWRNWEKFKELLIIYSQNKNEQLQREYKKLREQLEIDFNFFLPSIKSIQQASHRKYNELSIGNFEACIQVGNIYDWEKKIKRKLPEEIDCFDYLIIALKEDCKKPERK